MDSLVKSIEHKLRKLLTQPIVEYKKVILPAGYLRVCEKDFLDDKYFLASAQTEARRLVKHLALTVNSRLLDIGCSVGRLPIGIMDKKIKIQEYCGVDVSKKSIQWCKRYLTRNHQNFNFIYLNVRNERYNPKGTPIDRSFRFPFNDQYFDIIYLYSVFSHMTKVDIEFYLKEFKRTISKKGKMFLTVFVEEDVTNMAINPKDYRNKWKGELHCVRYNKSFFTDLLSKYRFKVDRFNYESEPDGQSSFYLSCK